MGAVRGGTKPSRAVTGLLSFLLNGVFRLAANCSRARALSIARGLARLMVLAGGASGPWNVCSLM